MKFDILTLFPGMFEGPFSDSIVSRAVKKRIVEINVHNLRAFAFDKRRTVDTRPFGGGPGMLMRVDIIDRAVESIKINSPKARVVLLDTKGITLNQRIAKKLANEDHLVLIAGHYEGVDHRVHEHIADEVISIGDYVLTGGELPAMVLIDSVTRLCPGVLGNEESLSEESFEDEGKIEYPQYTRPVTYKGWKVPEILLSGNHKLIKNWREG